MKQRRMLAKMAGLNPPSTANSVIINDFGLLNTLNP
jgi:hypothetical protein